MSMIQVTNLTFCYDGSYDNVFENVSFQLDTDWKLGLTGRNGRGKTTLLMLLQGKYDYRGSITASVGFDYFPYNIPDASQCAIDLLEEICPGVPQWRFRRELGALDIPEDALWRPFSTLSGGEQAKLQLAMLFSRENRFLLIDEPTNHLDVAGRALVSRYLSGKKGFLLVSHDRAFLDGCVDHIMAIGRSSIEIQRGNFSSWYENKQRQDAFELEQNAQLKKEIGRLQDAARQSRAWADKVESTKIGPNSARVKGEADAMGGRAYIGEQSRRMQQRRKNLERRQQTAIAEKSALLKNIESAAPLKLSQLPYHAKTLAELRGVSIRYGERIVCSGVTFSIQQGDRIALCGANGTGKSSVLKLLCGERIEHGGTLLLGSQLKISYVPQDASFLRGNLSDYAAQYEIDESLFKAILRKLDFARVQFEKDMADFSAGQKKKVLLARSLCEQAHLHIWDEPLNYIDVFSRIQIENLLLDFRPTILFVEHDRVFCEKIATKTVALSRLDTARSGLYNEAEMEAF